MEPGGAGPVPSPSKQLPFAKFLSGALLASVWFCVPSSPKVPAPSEFMLPQYSGKKGTGLSKTEAVFIVFIYGGGGASPRAGQWETSFNQSLYRKGNWKQTCWLV